MCSVPSCDRPDKVRGLCHGHYLRFWKTGDVQADKPLRQIRGDLATRFWSKVARTSEDECWLWLAYIDRVTGYGRIGVNGKILNAHRVAYELTVGPIPDGLQIDHLCRVRACVNPSHLEPVTQAENIRRGESAEVSRNRPKSDRCRHGHLYDEENTGYYPNGQRRCRACNREIAKRSYEKKKAG